jgi:hypothetical protein
MPKTRTTRTTRINVTDRAPKHFRVTGEKIKRVSAADLAKALGGEIVGRSRTRPLTPVGLIALRERVAGMLKSTGGRPALEGAADRKKVPVLSGDWPKLEKMSAHMAHTGTKASPAQIASLLLHEKLEELEKEGVEKVSRHLAASATR